jgi:hypothetical protein
MQHNLALDARLFNHTDRRNPQWIIRECRACGGHPIAFGSDGWAVIHAFALEGWMALRDGNSVRLWFADVQEGTA